MAEMILPGTFIEVRPEGLIVPGRVSVGNLGVVGTASKGEIGKPTILSGYTEARQKFGDYDPWLGGNSNELTLNRALEQAFQHGATTVFAVRVAATGAEKAIYTLASASGNNVVLTAKTEGTWGNGLSVNVTDAEEHAFIEDEKHNGGNPISLAKKPVKSARNRIQLTTDADGLTRSLQIFYKGDAGVPAPLGSGQVEVDPSNGDLRFATGEDPAAADTVTASYLVDQGSAVKVTLSLGTAQEVYTVVDGKDLASDINDPDNGSNWVDAKTAANASELPSKSPSASDFASFSGGLNGEAASPADYKNGLEKLLNEDVQIVLAAGQDDSFGDELDAHSRQASSDEFKRDRIALVGSRLSASIDDLRGHSLNSDRVIFVAPGIRTTDAPSGQDVVLPGAYAAAAVAGLLSSFSPHISLTNKSLPVGGLEQRYTSGELKQLVLSRTLVLEERQGFRIVKGITTSTNTAWHQITTRRIVDFAKAGVRSAANPYIGLLNNERVRAAMQATINSFLQEMVDDEMLISYELAVTATREEEIKGIARVTIVLRPTFSIDFIKV
ncbi:MAG: phage tail sheath C-terminal domain-containing protein, partial [Acidobacteriota bacterium]